jgi:dihydrofolate reductase
MKLIVAIDENGGIGRDGGLPWNLKEDMAFFKEMTNGGIVIMGSGCYDSLPDKFKPLPNRLNVVISRSDRQFHGCMTFKYPFDILDDDYLMSKENIWVIGGSQIYDIFIDIVDELYVTEVMGSFSCDVWFPKIDDEKWIKYCVKKINGGTIYKYKRK